MTALETASVKSDIQPFARHFREEMDRGKAEISICYLSHTDTTGRLYLQETFVFRVVNSEAAVALAPAPAAAAVSAAPTAPRLLKSGG